MGLTPGQDRVLRDLVDELPRDCRWCLFGSADSVLRGLEDEPSDVDVVTTIDGAATIRETFPDAFVAARDVGDARLDTYRVHGEELEVIVADGGSQDADPIVDVESVALDRSPDRGVPMLPLPELLAAYRSIDKHETAERLETAFAGGTE